MCERDGVQAVGRRSSRTFGLLSEKLFTSAATIASISAEARLEFSGNYTGATFHPLLFHAAADIKLLADDDGAPPTPPSHAPPPPTVALSLLSQISRSSSKTMLLKYEWEFN